jgi:hypothetical protein
MQKTFVSVLLSASLLSATVHAQSVPGSAGVSSDPYTRPSTMDANDKASDSAMEQLRRGLQEKQHADAVAAAKSGGGRARPAKADEVVAGAALMDKTGTAIGTVESVESDGVVVATLLGKVKVPLEALGKNKEGLLVDLSKSEFDGLVSQANAPASH